VSVLRVTATLAAPIVADEEIHLDALLIAARPGPGTRPTRSTPVAEITYPPLPIGRIAAHGAWTYACSTWQLPQEARGGREHLTKRRDAADVDNSAKAFTPNSGRGRNYLLPLPTIETPAVWWTVVGRRGPLKKLLRYVPAIGSKRRHGYGRVLRWDVELSDADPLCAFVFTGRANRWLPASWVVYASSVDNGPVIPPYWHPGLCVDRVRPGQLVTLHSEVLAKIKELS